MDYLRRIGTEVELASLDERIMADWFRPDYTARFGSAQAIFKTALNLQGLPGGFPRRPILPLASRPLPKAASPCRPKKAIPGSPPTSR